MDVFQTVVAGVPFFVFGQIVAKFLVEPWQEYKRSGWSNSARHHPLCHGELWLRPGGRSVGAPTFPNAAGRSDPDVSEPRERALPENVCHSDVWAFRLLWVAAITNKRSGYVRTLNRLEQ